MDPNISTYDLLLILPVTLSAVWVLIDLFYASWLLAVIANFVINAFLPKGTGIHIGRLKISLLTGRIIFKDLQYFDRDNSLFITDGYGVLRWWKKELSNDNNSEQCRTRESKNKLSEGKNSSLVFLQLNGVEYHWYNRKEIYDEWGKPKLDENENEANDSMSWIKQIRPSVYCSINKGRLMFGNQLTERTLAIYFQHGQAQYKMIEASNTYDELMHSISWHADKIRAVLEPSVGYNGPYDQIPKCTEVTSDGHDNSYLLLKTDSIDGLYSLDIPGLVPIDDTSSPKFAFDVYLGSNSVINYGSYANRQRINLIQKFFFPNDYTIRPISRLPQPGERRIYTSFDVSIYAVNNATINIFFEEHKEIRCLTFRVGGDSSLCIKQPWVTKDFGYTTTLSGKATDIEVLTSLPYETFGKCKTFEVETKFYFPRVWNAKQKWDMNFSLSNVQGSILFQYIDFFNGLIEDWLGDDPPDLLEFVPVDWNVNINMKEYEIFLHTSQYNWIDITTEGMENSRLAFCGKTGHMLFEFPFLDYLPKEQRISFTAHGQNIVIRKYIPPSCSTRHSQFQLSNCCKDRWRIMEPPADRNIIVEKKLLRSVSQPLDTTAEDINRVNESGALFGTNTEIGFSRKHIRRGSEPMLSKTQIQNIPLKEINGLELLLEENEQETTLNNIPTDVCDNNTNEFFPMGYRSDTTYESGWIDIACGPSLMIEITYKGHNYDPTHIDDPAHIRDDEKLQIPNEVHINVEAPSVLLRVYGSLGLDLLALRDNFLSEYVCFKTYFSESTVSQLNRSSEGLDLSKLPNLSTGPNIPNERFLNVTVDFKLQNVMGELPTHLPDNFPSDFPLVSGMTELFTVHAVYSMSETCIELHVNPISINLPSLGEKDSSTNYNLGYLLLSSVDFCCHGYTEFLLKERVEYAWLMKLDLGQIAGTVSTPQLLPVVDFFQTAANHILSYGDDFVKAPDAVVIEPVSEPLSELLKYKLFAVNISTIDVNLRDKECLLKLKSLGFSLDLCNIHNNKQTLAVSLQLHDLVATAFVATPTNHNILMEAGNINIGTIRGEISLREPEEAMADRQQKFFKRADNKTHRLWFVWNNEYNCGCSGGCQFLSSCIKRSNGRDVNDPLIVSSPYSRDGASSPILATPSKYPFISLKTLHYLHSNLISYHFNNEEHKDPPLEDTPILHPSTSSLPSISVIQEDVLSQADSDDSFHSAHEYLGSEEVNDELFHSIHNTPRASVKHSRQSSKHSHQLNTMFNIDKKTKSIPPVTSNVRYKDISDDYKRFLNSYRCSWKSIKLLKQTSFSELKSGAHLTGGVTPKRGRKKDDGPKFIVEVPKLIYIIDRSPYILRGNHMPTTTFGDNMTGHKMDTSEDNTAMFSVEINLTSFDIFLSPPFVAVINRYIECANLLFTTRSPHLLLEVLSLTGLGSVQSHLKEIQKSTSSIPSSNTAPLVHLSVLMDPTSHGSIQFLQAAKILKPGTNDGRNIETNQRCSLLCFYTTGFQGNALVHHNSIKVNLNNSNTESSTNLQMTLKIAGKFCLPVLQAGLFAITFTPKSESGSISNGINQQYSCLEFIVEPSSVTDNHNQSVSIKNIAELSMNKFLLTTAAKIIQSEFSSTPILMWSDICDDVATPTKERAESPLNISRDQTRDSDQSNNSLVIDLTIPSVRLQFGGPKHGIPAHNEICIDPSLIFALVDIWKPLIENVIASIKKFWRNKITRDRQLILTLITAAMETIYKQKPRNPLLTSLSNQLRDTVVYCVIHQLWQGLPLANDERLSGFPTNYQEGFLIQELVATLLSLSLRLHVQRSSLLAIPCTRARKSQLRPSIISEDTSNIGYFSISPSASELAIVNTSYTKQQRENIDYTSLVKAVQSNDSLLYLRESLLPLFTACNVQIAPQLNVKYHNHLKLTVDYNIQLDEAAILIIDGREEMPLEYVDDQVGVVPEFLLDHLCITGFLEHVAESRIVVESLGYLVTVRSNSANKQRNKHRTNITSKCYVGLDAIATHITLPLLMLSRHTNISIRHWQKSFRTFRNDTGESNVTIDVQNNDDTCVDELISQSSSWLTTKSLVNVLITMENSKMGNIQTTSLSKQATPRGSQRNMNISTSSNYPLSLKALSTISKTYGLEESSIVTKRRHSIESSSSLDSPDKTDHMHTTTHPIISSGGGADGGNEDTTDSPHVFSSDPEGPIQTSMSTYNRKESTTRITPVINPIDYVPELSPVIEMPNMNEILAVPDYQLEFSVCGSVRIKSMQVSSQVETLLVMLEMRNISSAIDCRQITPENKTDHTVLDHTPLVYKLLPTYLSISSTLQQCCIRIFDSAVSKGDLAVLSANPLVFSTSIYYGHKHPAPAYRSLFRLPHVELDMKEPPIILHKKFHKYIPTFTAVVNEVFAPLPNEIIDEKLFTSTTQSTVTISDLQFPPHLPRGSFLFHLAWFKMIIRPLSSLTVKYQLAPVTAQLGTSSVIKFSMNIGQHNLEFVPKESKDELSLRNIPLPAIALKGSIVPRPSSRLPSISAELAMKQVVVDITTDVFNQLLVLQTSFIKEINDLFNMFLNIGESIPQKRLSSINLKQSTESSFELISLLSSVKLSLQGIKFTVSTPTQTALRFSTGNKIEMLVTNPSHQAMTGQNTAATGTIVDQLTLHGKVETEISISLGYLQDDNDEEDDFIELAYFKTWITIKNTLQQNTSLPSDLSNGSVNYPASLDAFLISIMAPHLYIQSTAVEKAILFWVNCKSVYNFWQNEHKLLNAEVQAATVEFVGRITKPSTQIKAPSFDFSKPRLVQITVNDVGACMPLIPLPTTPHNSQKGFPALVLTIKDMQVTLNLSKKLGSAGKFSDFCVRFDERFHFRHKTWTVDPKKHKYLNYGEVPNGTYRFCIVNRPTNTAGEDDIPGEKLVSAFTWHMSGISTNTTTLIGRHISTLVRTLTTIGSDLEESSDSPQQNSSGSGSIGSKSNSPAALIADSTKRRYSYSFVEEQNVLRALEVDLAKQTRKLLKLRQSGATPDSLKNEEDNFHKLEVDIARGLRRVFRKGRGMSIQQWSELLYPRSPIGMSNVRDTRKRYGTLPRRMVRFEEDSEHNHPLHQSKHSPRTHARHKSDITPDVKRLLKREADLMMASSGMTHGENLEAVVEDSEDEDYTKKGSSPSKVSQQQQQPLLPSIDIEIHVTINVDSGQMVLLSEDISSHEQQKSFNLLGGDSPLMSSRRTKQTPSVQTTILIPAVEVKAHYQSVLSSSYSTSPPSPMKPHPPHSPQGSDTLQHNVIDSSHVTIETSDRPVKKGVLSVAVIISSLLYDLELNPSILDFIEQVVRPINISAQELETVLPADMEDDETKEDVTELPVVVKKSDTRPISFPVDVCLNFQIHPSKIILTCNPHARVKCQIAIPTVSFVVSFSLFSKLPYDSQALQSRNESPVSQLDSSITSAQSTSYNDNIITINNICVTGCLQTFQLTMFTPNVQSSAILNNQPEDKEVISLVLGQAFIHLSRSSVFVNDQISCKLSTTDDVSIIEKLKVSIVPHIESLILFYDWRRLNDVTWFRKCWYHTGLVEALFIGKKPTEDSISHNPPSPYHGNTTSAHIWSPGSSIEESSPEVSSVDGSDTITAELVVAVSIADMRLTANVAQLMGNAYIQVSHLRGEAHADIKDNELVFLDIDGILEELEIDAQGGVVAGNLRIHDTNISVNSSSQIGCIPEHKANCRIGTIEGHIDYMSAIILLVKATVVNINVCDVWDGINLDRTEHTTATPKIQVCCTFKWSSCQLSIHRATAKGMFGIIQRVYDFIIQQKKRSERMIGSMIPAGTTASSIFAAYQAEQMRAEKSRAAEIENPLLEYHHWIWAVRVGSIRLMNALGIQISADHHDVSLGGVINVSGDTLSVVCFHGTSFRDKEWVVFNIDLISAKFSTLAIPGLGSMMLSEISSTSDLSQDSTANNRRICQQICVLELGNESAKLTDLAAIYRVMSGRGGVPPISPNEVSDWLNYVCINQYLNSNHGAITKPVGYPKESQKLSIQPICCLPAFSFKLINDHLWPSLRQLEEQIMNGIMESATIECTLMTNFSDGIAVTTTVENYLFIHDLFKAYIDYLDKQNVSFRPPFTTVNQSTTTATPDVPKEDTKASKCLRRFVNVHWELDPRIVLLATAQWASGHFNPHITWVLDKLGFKEARTTIPKYIQRGLMDPLDLGIATVVELLVELSATKKLRTIDENSV